MQGISKRIELKPMPWVGVGTDVSQSYDITEVLQKANLNYAIELINVYDESGVQLTGFYAIRRSNKKDTAYGFVKNRYIAPQNNVEFTFFDRYIKHTGSTYGFAGSLYDGEIVWFFAKDDNLITIGDISIRIYSMLTLYQTGRHSKQVTFIPIREDSNSVFIAPIYSSPNSINIPNKKSLIEQNEIIESILELKNNYVSELTKQLEAMYNRKVTPKEEKTFFSKVVSNSPDSTMNTLSGTYANKIANMLDFYNNHPTQEKIAGTLFGLYNSVVGYYMHVKDYKPLEKRFNNIFIGGDAYRDSEEAFRLAKRMI